MKVLLIEDEDRSARQTKREVLRHFPNAELLVARNLEDAKAVLAANSFDLLLCDLKIPSAPKMLDANVDFGRAAYALARSSHPGMPAIFLSANATTRNTGHEMASGGVFPILGMDALPLTQNADKGTDDLREHMKMIAAGVARLEACHIGSDTPLDPMFIRAAQMYGASQGSPKARAKVTDGLSGSRVGIVTYAMDPHPPASVVLKVDRLDRIGKEADKFHRYVNNRLPAGCFAAPFLQYEAGLRGCGALFSTVVGGAGRTLFAALSDNPGFDPVPALHEAFSSWRPPVRTEAMTVQTLRELSVTDSDLRASPHYSHSLLAADHVAIDVAFRIEHGDLHGENVLVDTAGSPTIIDFADTDILPSSYDAVGLELSLLAHPKAPQLGSWPSDDQLRRWDDVDFYAQGCPFEGLVRSCRTWAESQTTRTQLLAVALVQSSWLLKHVPAGGPRMHIIAEGLAMTLVSLDPADEETP